MFFRENLAFRISCNWYTIGYLKNTLSDPAQGVYVWLGVEEFEPRLTVPETAVLPLDEPPKLMGGYFTMGGLERQTSMVSGVCCLYRIGAPHTESVLEI